jgi:hypothetical protein
MKRTILLLSVSVCLFLIILPDVSAACLPVQTATPTTAPPGPDGTIYVESSPAWAVVYINGDNKGHAPVTITGLWPGSYSISVEMPGYQDFTTTTSISGATRSAVYCTLMPDVTGNGLFVVSTPLKAHVYLDGALKGLTPLMLSATPGTHTIQLKLSGYSEWKSTVEAPVGGTKTVSAILEETDVNLIRGINISTNPKGARVILDGVAKGVSPVTLNDIAAGIHVLEIENPGYVSWKSTVDVPEAEIKDISVNLVPNPERMPGWIVVSSKPENASVTVDGNYAGRTPANSTLNLDTITPGEYTIVLSLPGYRPYSTKVTVSPNLVTLVNTTLIPVSGPGAKGALSVTSEPAGATIFVDNKSMGISPLTVNDISVGNHVVAARMDGYDDYSTSILVSAGATRTVSATLLKVTPTLHSPAFPLLALVALGIFGLFILGKKR